MNSKNLIYRGVGRVAKGRSKGTGNREQGTGMAAAAVIKAFPSDQRERFRGRWAGRKAGSEEVVPPAVSLICVLSH